MRHRSLFLLFLFSSAVACALPAAASAKPRDRDRDRLPDSWERRYKVNSPRADVDRDRLSNGREYRLRTHPRRADTDRDGLRDGDEVMRYRTNPRRRDTDRDGFGDGVEVKAGTNPRKASSRPTRAASPLPAPAPPPGSGGDAGAVVAGTGGAGIVGPRPENFTCDRTATTATFRAEVTAAVAGQTVCLASGSYGAWGGTNKAITVRALSGASPSLTVAFGSGASNFTVSHLVVDGGDIRAGAKNITIRNSVFTSHLKLDGLANANVLLDHNSHVNINSPAGGSNSRIGLYWGSSTPSGVTISNSLFQGGDADGVHTGVAVDVINNAFVDLCDKGGNHTDNIQFEGAVGGVIRGNYVHARSGCTTQGITSYDGGTEGVLIENNVVDIRRAWGIEFYADRNSVIRHNTLRYYAPGCYGGSACGQIDINRKSSDPAGSGTQVYDNIATAITVMNGSTVARRDHNMVRQSAGAGDFVGAPAFAGGAGPTTWAGFQLTASSPGNNAASDGSDVGIRP